MIDHLRTLSRYNKWANTRLAAAAADIDEDAFFAERGAFFGSIHGTLDHILLVDRLWRGRVTGELYAIDSLGDRISNSREAYGRLRAEEDDNLIAFVDGFSDDDLVEDVVFTSTAGEVGSASLLQLLTHMFNHATHHRGQAHGLLSQVPSEPPPLDFIYYLRDQ